MKNEDLKTYLGRLPVPEPDEAAKSRAVHSALAAFRRQAEEKNKGYSHTGRLMGKLIKGGPGMQRPIAITSGIAVGFIALAIALSPTFISQKKASFHSSGNLIATDREGRVPATMPSATDSQENFVLEEITAEPRKRAENQQKVSAAMEVISSDDLQEIGKANVDDILRDISNVRTNNFTNSKQASPNGAAPNESSSPASPPPVAVTVDGAHDNTAATGQVLFDVERMETPATSQDSGGRDKFDTITPNPFKLVTEEPVSTFSIDVDTASYAFVRRALNNGYLPQANAVRIEELINYFDYDYPLPEDRSTPFKPTVAIFPTPWNDGTKLLHIGIKGYDIVPEKKPRSNLIFLVDVSGSMRSDDKLPLLKNSLRMLVNTLEPGDTVGIVVYAGAAGTVLEPTSVAERGKILTALDRLQAGGSTAGGKGIKLAYSLAETNMDPGGVNRIILATDGDFNVGIRDPEALKDFVARKRETGVYLSVLGFGQGNYNDTLMQKLAQNGNGNAAYIDTLSEARKVLVDEASGTLFTIAGDVKLQVEFNPAMVAEYRLIGYESRLLNREDFKNDAVDAGDIGSGHSVTALYEITPTAGSTRFIDPLRYQSDGTNAADSGNASEYAFLKIRYKLPGESASQEISKAIGKSDEYQSLPTSPESSRFAAAVAAFSQLIRGDSYTQNYGYEDVLSLAKTARGEDPYGYRSEFMNLVRLAETAGAMGER